MKRLDVARWLVMGSLVLAGGTIYTLPYLRQSYHRTLLEAMDVTNTELGFLNAMFGFLALACYFPGGWLADRLEARKLLTFSLVTSGVAGLVVATFPPYPVLLALHAFWGVSTILTFWAALIKATRAWGSNDEQGRAFGILEGGRGIVEALLGVVAIAVFAACASAVDGLAGVIAVYSAATILAGIAVWRFVPDRSDEASGERGQGVSLRQLVSVLRLPVVWLHAVVILCAYSVFWGTLDLAAFATDAFDQSDVFGASLSNFRMWLRPVAAIGAGFIADKVSASRAVTVGFGILAGAFALFAAMPATPELVWALWVDTAIASIAVFAIRGVYYALLEEGGVPLALTGTAVGLVSVIGYTPDAFMPLLTGWLFDTYPGAAGHQYLYAGLAAVAVVGAVATQVLRSVARGDSSVPTPAQQT